MNEVIRYNVYRITDDKRVRMYSGHDKAVAEKILADFVKLNPGASAYMDQSYPVGFNVFDA